MDNTLEAATGAPLPFDVSSYELADTAVLTLKNKVGTDDLLGRDGQPVTIEIYSPGSEQGVKAQRKYNTCTQMRTARMFRGEIDRKDAQVAEQELADKLVGFTKRISDNFPIAPANLYANPKLGYITRQVLEFIAKESNF